MNEMFKKNELKTLSKKTILITGAGGMLGSAFVEMLDRHLSGGKVLAYTHLQLDVTNRKAVLSLFNKNPDIIIHCAANVNADHCEEHPEYCYDVQVNGTRNILDLAKKNGAKVFYPQSFLIFDGNALPITEETEPHPLSVYGKCKLEAEKLIRENLLDSLVVRMSGFFGGYNKDKNFVGKFVSHIANLDLDRIKSQEVGDRVWQPTYTNDLAYNSLLLLSKDKKGVYNMACHGETSFYALSCNIVNQFNLKNLLEIKQISAENFKKKEKAARPIKAIMVNNRLQKEGLDRQRTWQESLYEYLDHPYFKRLFK